MGRHQYRELKVWQEAMALCKDLFLVVGDMPQEERFGIIAQIKKSAVSIPSNIAEGAGRNSDKDFNRFLNIAYGSSCELSTQLEIAKDFNLLDINSWQQLEDRINRIQKMLYKLSENLNVKSY